MYQIYHQDKDATQTSVRRVRDVQTQDGHI